MPIFGFQKKETAERLSELARSTPKRQGSSVEYPQSSPGHGRKRFVRFTFDEDLTTSMDEADATITHQYGPGVPNGDTSIVVKNLLTHTASVYEFHADSGDAGLAYWDSGQDYIIIIPECP
jgi:hypothetical protein